MASEFSSGWSLACVHEVHGVCAVDDNIVGLIFNEGFTFRVRGVWQCLTPLVQALPAPTSLIHVAHNVVYTGTPTGFRATSNTVCEMDLPDNVEPVAFASNQNKLFVASASVVFCLGTEHPHKLHGTLDGLVDIVSIAVWRNDIYVLTQSGMIFAFDAETMEMNRQLLLTAALGGPSQFVGVAVHDKNLFVALHDQVLCMDLDTKKFTVVVANVPVRQISASAKMLTVLINTRIHNFCF